MKPWTVSDRQERYQDTERLARYPSPLPPFYSGWRAGIKLQSFLADAKIFGLQSPLSAACFDFYLTNLSTKWIDILMGYGVASAKFTGAIYISIAARVPKLFRDSSRPQKGGVWELHENLALWQSRTGKNVLILFKWPTDGMPWIQLVKPLLAWGATEYSDAKKILTRKDLWVR